MIHLKLSNAIVAFLASAFQAFGSYNVHALADVTEGGVLGATLLLEYWLGISPAITGFLLNAACYLLGWRQLGKEFIGYSAVAAVGFSGCYWVCEQFPPLWPGLADMPLLASLLGAVFVGLGSGFCVYAGGATFGDDALAMTLNSATRIPIQYIYYTTDLSVLLLSLSYIPLERIVYSLLTVLLSSTIIGWIQKIPPKVRTV